jgi:hypothetical protein
MTVVIADRVAQALADAGLVHDLSTVRRIVIDLQVGQAAMVYVQRLGQPELAELLPELLLETEFGLIESALSDPEKSTEAA